MYWDSFWSPSNWTLFVLVVGYGKRRVRTAARALSDALRRAGAVISIKSVLEPVPEIPWLGKNLVFSGPNAEVIPKEQGWISLVGLWIWAAVLPLSKKHARRILGRYVWALRTNTGYAFFLSGW